MGQMTDEELKSIIGMFPGETQDSAIQRYAYEAEERVGSMLTRARASEQELKRLRKIIRQMRKPMKSMRNLLRDARGR
jgi:tRNA C32,U32 (ribose-2'-O)-methylase TrmJ